MRTSWLIAGWLLACLVLRQVYGPFVPTVHEPDCVTIGTVIKLGGDCK